jgi:hypothetical protein
MARNYKLTRLAAAREVRRRAFEPQRNRGPRNGRASTLGYRSRRDLMIVAQHFSAGSTIILNAARPVWDDRTPVALVRSHKVQSVIFSIVPNGTVSCFRPFPAINCWATFVESLRDRSIGIANVCHPGLCWRHACPRSRSDSNGVQWKRAGPASKLGSLRCNISIVGIFLSGP